MYSKSPMRISFGGGGTDVSPYRESCGGMTLGMAINKYAYAELTEEEVGEHVLVNAIKDKLGFKGNIKITSEAQPFSGLGASGSISIAVIALITNGRMEKAKMADLAFEVERIDLGVKGGCQDAIFSAFGSFSYLEFGENRFSVLPMINNGFSEKLEGSCLIVYMGPRQDNILIHEDEARRTMTNIESLDVIKEIGNEMRRYARAGNFEAFSELLHLAWMEKRKLSSLVSTREIDEYYDEILKHGALGGKASGAGGGGYLMLLCKDVNEVMEYSNKMGYYPERVKIDWEGVKVYK